VFHGHRRKVRILFGLSDILLIALAFEAAYWLRAAAGVWAPVRFEFEHTFFLTTPVKVLLIGWSMVVWVALGSWWEIYDHIDSARPRLILGDAFRQSLTGAVSMVLFEFLLRLDLSRPFLGLFAALGWIFLCLFRLSATRLLGWVRKGFAAPLYVMVVGVGEAALKLGREIEEAASYGLRLTGFLDETGENKIKVVELAEPYPVRPLAELPELLRRHVIDEIVFAVDSSRLGELEEMFLMCDEEGVRTRVGVDFFPHINSQVYLDRLGSSSLLTFSGTPSDEIRLLVKRGIDMALSAAALVVVLPLMMLIALLIRLTSPGPAIFRQVRCGLSGRRFVFYKFRSMCNNAEQLRASLEDRNERETVFKMRNDPRLTGVGRWLRKFSIDEWPQLWNVLKGDMSLVGPRPALPDEVERYQRWQRRRLRMRPGLTCLWAVKGRDSVDFDTWMRLDMEYIDRWSLALDWQIMLRTVPRVLSGRGAH